MSKYSNLSWIINSIIIIDSIFRKILNRFNEYFNKLTNKSVENYSIIYCVLHPSILLVEIYSRIRQYHSVPKKPKFFICGLSKRSKYQFRCINDKRSIEYINWLAKWNILF